MKQETKKIIKIMLFATLYALISVAIASIGHEYYHQWSLRNVAYNGTIILSPSACGKDALFCYSYYVIPGKEDEYKQIAKFEETRAYILTFVLGFILTLCLLLLHSKIDVLCSREPTLNVVFDEGDKTSEGFVSLPSD